jgi:hypothetical protein
MWFAGLGKYAPGEEVHVDTLNELGYQIVAYPVVGHVRAMNAFTELFSDLRTNGVVDVEGLDEGGLFINEVIEVPAYYAIEDRRSSATTFVH